MYTVRIDPSRFGLDARELLKALEAVEIQTRPLWQPIHLSPAHRTDAPTDCPVSEMLYREALSLPCSVGLPEEDQQRVIDEIRKLARSGPGGARLERAETS